MKELIRKKINQRNLKLNFIKDQLKMKKILFLLKKMQMLNKSIICFLKVILILMKIIKLNFSKKMMELWQLIGIMVLNLVWKKKKIVELKLHRKFLKIVACHLATS